MKNYLLIMIGFKPPTPEMMNDWMTWFKSIDDKIVNQMRLSNGREVTKNTIKTLPMDEDAITGCLTIKANDMDEAIEIAKKCPMITSTKVYEMMS